MRTVCIALLILSVARAAAADDDGAERFLLAHRAGVARNEGRVQLTVRFSEGRSSFRQGEHIAIDLVFTPGWAKPHSDELNDGWDLTDVVLDRLDGVAMPFRILDARIDSFSFPRGMPGCVIGGVLGAPPPQTSIGSWQPCRPGHVRIAQPLASAWMSSAGRAANETRSVKRFERAPPSMA
jgi:hypothetical protein